MRTRFVTKEELALAMAEEGHLRDQKLHQLYDTLMIQLDSLKRDLDTDLLRILRERDFIGEMQSSRDIEVWITTLLEREVKNSLNVGTLRSLVMSIVEEELKNRPPPTVRVSGGGGGGLTREEVDRMIGDALDVYDSDKIGKADYALQSAGSSIVYSRTSASYSRRGGLLDWLLLRGHSSSPSLILQPDNSVGNCWAFPGSHGNVTIKLAAPVVPTEFTLDHIAERISYHFESCPREYQVWGLRSEGDTMPHLFGRYVYHRGAHAIQTNRVQVTTCITSSSSYQHSSFEAFPYVTLEILSNYGHEDYTCVYRFRVHGVTPQSGQ